MMTAAAAAEIEQAVADLQALGVRPTERAILYVLAEQLAEMRQQRSAGYARLGLHEKPASAIKRKIQLEPP